MTHRNRWFTNQYKADSPKSDRIHKKILRPFTSSTVQTYLCAPGCMEITPFWNLPKLPDSAIKGFVEGKIYGFSHGFFPSNMAYLPDTLQKMTNSKLVNVDNLIAAKTSSDEFLPIQLIDLENHPLIIHFFHLINHPVDWPRYIINHINHVFLMVNQLISWENHWLWENHLITTYNHGYNHTKAMVFFFPLHIFP